MLIPKQKVKKETRVDKIKIRKNLDLLKSTERTGCGKPKHTGDAAQVSSPCVRQSRRATDPSVKKKEIEKVTSLIFIPVLDKNGKALMPCNPARARELLGKGKAIAQHLKGIFHIKMLSVENSKTQDICLGIDPGSKREGFTAKSEHHTYINVLANAVTWVKDSVEVKRNMRRARRFRKTPCRKNKYNKGRSPFPPSTKSRWQNKLRIIKLLMKLYPITDFIVEDISAITKKGCKKWNKSFSPLEVGKEWFYGELRKLGKLEVRQGYETKEERDKLGLIKTKSKLDDVFSAHNVDSWVLANYVVGGHIKPDNEKILRMVSLQFSKRQLHRLQCSKGSKNGERNRYGGTKSGKYTRGMLVKHNKYGLCYVGGYMENVGISLHNIFDGKRLCQNSKEKDIRVMCYNAWRIY
jgi:hypothetical protein